MSEFILDAGDVSYAEKHPFNGCYHPLKAAYGRVAEPSIVKLGAKTLGLSVEEYNSSKLPKEHRAILGVNKRHDGLLFDGSTFVGVIEAKLALRSIVKITFEKPIYEYCKKHNLRYEVALGEMVDVRQLKCKYIGVFDLCQNSSPLDGVDISVTKAKSYLKV
jgi:hypothetical protein